MKLRRALIAILAVVLGACASIPRPPADPAREADSPPYAAWARVLERYVDEAGRVDFVGVSRSRSDLDRFVAYVYDVAPEAQPSTRFPTRADVLAYHLNAYNALAMHAIIDRGIPETLAGLRKISFFALGKVQVGGRPISLYDYENDVIRPLGDPRVHVALNCMSVGCPRLPREPFLPDRLEAQLEREARRFYNEPRNVRVDHGRRTVGLTEILKWFPEDFLRVSPSLIAYVNRYRSEPLPADYAIEWISYDWTVNRQR